MKQFLIAAVTAIALSSSYVALGADKVPTQAEQEKAYQQYMEKMQAHMKLMQEQSAKFSRAKTQKNVNA
jgi:opacity protein-like surface antigen